MTADFPSPFLSLSLQQQEDAAVDQVTETIQFVTDETRSTKSLRHVVRRRRIKHQIAGYGSWFEEFEDSFTVPVGSMSLDVFLSQLGDRKTSTSVTQRTIFILRKLVANIPHNFFNFILSKKLIFS